MPATILADDHEIAGSVSLSDVKIIEGDDGTRVAVFTLTRTGGTAAFEVDYSTSDGNASASSDYVAAAGTIAFGRDVTTQTISITINGDLSVEADETFFLTLTAATNGATIGDAIGTGIIVNDDHAVPGSVSISDVKIIEGDDGTRVAVFTLTRTGGTAAFEVNYSTSDGNASASSDYVAAAGTIAFGRDVTTQTISITINGDLSVEADETFFLTLTGATNGATIGDASGTGIIVNDDHAVPGSVSISDVQIVEGDDGTRVAVFTLTRTGGTAAFEVNYSTSDGSATASSDYVAAAGTIAFGRDVTTQTTSITINGDLSVEADETFFLTLTAATNGAVIGDASGTGIIINDDHEIAGSVSISDVQIAEGDDGTRVATFTLTRTGGTAAFEVNYSTSDGSATASSDYVAAAGTVTFNPDVDAQAISVVINGDSSVEGNETFFVNLAGATNGANIFDGAALGTILNDDVTSNNSLVLQPGPEGQDTSVINAFIQQVRFDDGMLRVGAWEDFFYSLIRFELADPSIPAHVNSATLRLYRLGSEGTSAISGIYVDQLNAPWIESTGVFADTLEYTSVGIASVRNAGWLDIDVTSAVNNWLSQPASNFGIQLRPFGNETIVSYFSSSDASGSNAAFRPQLVLNWGNGGGGQSPVPAGQVLVGGPGDDALFGTRGDDIFLGNGGLDTAVVNAKMDTSDLQLLGGSIHVAGPDGLDILTGISRIAFIDAIVAFDVQGAAGVTYRLYQAAFDRTPDTIGLSANVHLMDEGLSLQDMSAAFIASHEFTALYGASISDAQFVFLLYRNVLHRDPDPEGMAGWQQALANGSLTRAAVLSGFSESAENHATVDPTLALGIVLDPHYF